MSESPSTPPTAEVAANPPPRSEEAAAPADAPVDPRDQRIAALEADLRTARARVDELARAYQAGERDREAFKLRLSREREQMLEVEKGKVVLSLVEALDQLDRCLAAADESPLASGVKLIRGELLKKVQEAGVERVELTGAPYDPNLAEATDLGLVTEEAQDGLVLAVERACYRQGSRVIRPGRVKVAKYVKPAEA